MRICFLAVAMFTVIPFLGGSRADAFSYGHSAGVAAYSGDVAMVSAPLYIRNGTMESNHMAAFFVEQEDFMVSTPIPVDTLAAPGRYDDMGDFEAGEITGMVNSYFLHVDSVPHRFIGFGLWPRRYRGSITFDNPIVGLIGFADTLMDTRELQADSTRYPLRRHHNHDLDPILGSPIGDTVWISNDLKTLGFDFLNSNRMDQVRILTAVPEPSALLLFTFAGFSMFFQRMRR